MQSKEKEILSITQEECAEVVQAVSKVNRFGIDAMHNGATNRERLTEETGDLFCMIELMIEFGLIDRTEMLLAAGNKREKLSKWSNIFQEEND
jgi:NTP pyrophosphatase (non-canonical NTP hydrolase)